MCPEEFDPERRGKPTYFYTLVGLYSCILAIGALTAYFLWYEPPSLYGMPVPYFLTQVFIAGIPLLVLKFKWRNRRLTTIILFSALMIDLAILTFVVLVFQITF